MDGRRWVVVGDVEAEAEVDVDVEDVKGESKDDVDVEVEDVEEIEDMDDERGVGVYESQDKVGGDGDMRDGVMGLLEWRCG
jgi:hypothetical protein